MPKKFYYKAVKPDGTDFATGRTKPVVGEWMPKIDGSLVMCQRGYHVSDEPAETLIGGSWPCRLFLVEIKDRKPERSQHKYVVHTYRPVEELPAWMALGPNGQEVAALIERAGRLTPAETRALHAAWDAAWGAAWGAARDAAWDAARDAARDAAWGAAWDAARDAASGAAWGAAWDAARGAAWACDALLVKDLINTAQFDILYGPWATVIEGKK
jgi:uncharacterized protein YceK